MQPVSRGYTSEVKGGQVCAIKVQAPWWEEVKEEVATISVDQAAVSSLI
jgi:hypothetical protein